MQCSGTCSLSGYCRFHAALAGKCRAVRSKTQPYGSSSYQYDAASRLTRLTWADGFYVTYDYDTASRMTAIRENGAASGIGVLATYSYDSLGRRSAASYGNGTSRAYGWDSLNRLAGIKVDLAGTTNDHTIGQAGGGGTPIAYNPAGQITSILRSNNAYLYTGRYNVARTYQANVLNQYVNAGGVAMTYDARGNLTASGASAYTYSKLNELKTGPGATMIYDPAGRLLQYTAGAATRFAHSGSAMISENSSAGAILRRYVPGPGEAPVVWYEGAGTASRRWLQGDERGSVVAVSDASGAALAINRYDEYGIPQAGNLGRFQYTGQTWFAELGLYNYKARWYSATMGRFMQTDPIGYGDGLNWYDYVGGDPVNATDPTGTDIVVVAKKHKQDGGGGGGGDDIVVTGARSGGISLGLNKLILRTNGGGMGGNSIGGGGGGVGSTPIVVTGTPPAEKPQDDSEVDDDEIVVTAQPNRPAIANDPIPTPRGLLSDWFDRLWGLDDPEAARRNREKIERRRQECKDFVEQRERDRQAEIVRAEDIVRAARGGKFRGGPLPTRSGRGAGRAEAAEAIKIVIEALRCSGSD